MTHSQSTVQTYFVDGHSLEAARMEGRHSNLPTIVMLHEGLGSVSHWRDFPSQIAEKTGASVFVYSRYGHGASDDLQQPRPVSYLHHEAQVVLPEILRQAQIHQPVLLGHSDGASIAIIYAGTFPDSPAALILEAPHVFVEELSVSSIAQARQTYLHTDLPLRLKRHHANADALFWGWNNIWLHPDFREWNIESFLDPIRCPVLVLQGAQDEYGTLKQVEAIRARIPSTASVILDNCKHSPHRDQPEATLAAIVRFLYAITSTHLAQKSQGVPLGAKQK